MKPVARIKRATLVSRPEKDAIDVQGYAVLEQRGQQTRPGALAAVRLAHEEAREIAVALGFLSGIGELLDDLQPDVAHEAVGLSLQHPGAPSIVVGEMIAHPRG